MAFFRSLSDTSGPADVFTKYPEIYGPWADTGQALMNGPSPLTPGEREMIAAYVVGVAKCDYAYVAHCAAAYAWGIEEGLIDKLLNNLDAAPIENRFKPLLSYAAKLTSTPENINQADADAVFDAGWDEQGLHDTIAVTARMNFMCRLVQGHGFIPMSPEKARENAAKRVEKGYRNLYPEFMKE